MSIQDGLHVMVIDSTGTGPVKDLGLSLSDGVSLDQSAEPEEEYADDNYSVEANYGDGSSCAVSDVSSVSFQNIAQLDESSSAAGDMEADSRDMESDESGDSLTNDDCIAFSANSTLDDSEMLTLKKHKSSDIFAGGNVPGDTEFADAAQSDAGVVSSAGETETFEQIKDAHVVVSVSTVDGSEQKCTLDSEGNRNICCPSVVHGTGHSASSVNYDKLTRACADKTICEEVLSRSSEICPQRDDVSAQPGDVQIDVATSNRQIELNSKEQAQSGSSTGVIGTNYNMNNSSCDAGVDGYACKPAGSVDRTNKNSQTTLCHGMPVTTGAKSAFRKVSASDGEKIAQVASVPSRGKSPVYDMAVSCGVSSVDTLKVEGKNELREIPCSVDSVVSSRCAVDVASTETQDSAAGVTAEDTKGSCAVSDCDAGGILQTDEKTSDSAIDVATGDSKSSCAVSDCSADTLRHTEEKENAMTPAEGSEMKSQNEVATKRPSVHASDDSKQLTATSSSHRLSPGVARRIVQPGAVQPGSASSDPPCPPTHGLMSSEQEQKREKIAKMDALYRRQIEAMMHSPSVSVGSSSPSVDVCADIKNEYSYTKYRCPVESHRFPDVVVPSEQRHHSTTQSISADDDLKGVLKIMPSVEDGLSSGHASDVDDAGVELPHHPECEQSKNSAAESNVDKHQVDVEQAIREIRSAIEKSKSVTLTTPSCDLDDAEIFQQPVWITRKEQASTTVQSMVDGPLNQNQTSQLSFDQQSQQTDEDDGSDPLLKGNSVFDSKPGGNRRVGNELQGRQDSARMRLHRHTDSESDTASSADGQAYRLDAAADYETDEETDELLNKPYMESGKVVDVTELAASPTTRAQIEKRRSKAREATLRDPENDTVLIEGVLFRASYLGSTQLISDGQPSKSLRMMQAQEAVGRIKAPVGENQPSTEVDLFISVEKIMVLNTDLQEIMMDHALRTISYIADIGDLLVLMARRGPVVQSADDGQPRRRTQTKICCHVFETEEAQLIAQSIGQAFQVAYVEFLKANGIDNPSQHISDVDYQDVLNQQEIFGEELNLFANRDMQKEIIIPKLRGEQLGIVIVESGWGSMVPTVVLANMSPTGAAARCGQLNIGDQIISLNGISFVGLPLSTCQNYIKAVRNQTVIKLIIVSCAPVVEVLIKRPDVKYQLGFSVQNGVICSLLRGGIAERGGVRVGHRIIDVNGVSVVAVPHERIVKMLATSVGEIRMKTMPMSIFRLLTGQDVPHYI